MLKDPETRERLVPKGERKAITARMKAEAWQATNGCCYICGASVPMTGPGVEYDHKLPLWLHGKHNVANIGPACPDPCHKAKTKREAPIRAKVVRIQKRRAGEEKVKRPINSPGFGARNRKFDGSIGPTKKEERRLSGRFLGREDGQLRDESESIRSWAAAGKGRS